MLPPERVLLLGDFEVLHIYSQMDLYGPCAGMLTGRDPSWLDKVDCRPKPATLRWLDGPDDIFKPAVNKAIAYEKNFPKSTLSMIPGLNLRVSPPSENVRLPTYLPM